MFIPLVSVDGVTDSKVPSTQTARGAHTRLLVVVGATLWYSRVEHCARSRHDRSDVNVPATDSYCSIEHGV